MEDRIQEELNDVIEREIRNVSTLGTGTKEKSDAVRDLSELYRLRIEEAKVEVDRIDRKKQREAEIRYRCEQSRSQAIDRWVNVGLQLALAVGGLMAYDVWYRRGLKFEETGTITSPMTKNLISRMIPRK